MSATALLLKETGWEVSGSDEAVYAPVSETLARHGIAWKTPYAPENIPPDAKRIVIGKNAKLTREENAETREAFARAASGNTRIASFPEVLGEATKERDTIVVAGSYGKSTTTALIAWCLKHASVDAGWFVGASMEGFESAHMGSHPVFVLEGDEYPAGHDDARPKFAHYHPKSVVLTAASHDHANVYPTQEKFSSVFKELLAGLPTDGLAVVCADEPHALALARTAPCRTVLYGLRERALWRADSIERGERASFDLVREGVHITRIETTLMGDHNIQNIVGAAALLLEKNLLSPHTLALGIVSFPGLARRLDKKTLRSRVPAFEAFGSSREKLRAALGAMKERFPKERVVLVFEPHTFSWRNKEMLHWYDDAFLDADFVILYKPAEQGAASHAQSTQEEMLARLQAAGCTAESAARSEDVLEMLKREVREGDVVLLSSSGPMDGLIAKIPEWLDTAFA